jgi:hypothetical protein
VWFAGHKVPDKHIIVIIEPKPPLSQNIRQLHKIRPNLENIKPIILRRPSKTLFLPIRPELFIIWRSDDTTRFAIPHHDKKLSPPHEKILQKAPSHRIVPLHVSNENVPCLNDIMLATTLASPADLMMMTVLVCVKVCEVREET